MSASAAAIKAKASAIGELGRCEYPSVSPRGRDGLNASDHCRAGDSPKSEEGRERDNDFPPVDARRRLCRPFLKRQCPGLALEHSLLEFVRPLRRECVWGRTRPRAQNFG